MNHVTQFFLYNVEQDAMTMNNSLKAVVRTKISISIGEFSMKYSSQLLENPMPTFRIFKM